MEGINSMAGGQGGEGINNRGGGQGGRECMKVGRREKRGVDV